MKASEIKKFKGTDLLHEALLTLSFSCKLIEHSIADTKIELKEMQRVKRAIEKRLLKGKELFKKTTGWEAILKT